MEKIKEMIVRWKKFLCLAATCEKNKKRDVIITLAAIMILSGVLFSGHFSSHRRVKEVKQEVSAPEEVASEKLETDIVDELKNAEHDTDMGDWKEYKNDWFGFDVRYPKDWKYPSILNPAAVSKWEQKVQFRKTKIDPDGSYVGFDVVVYDTNKTRNLMDTQEFPALKFGSVREEGKCDTIEGHVFETGDYPAEEIYIPINDDCYEPTLFFTFTEGQYTYSAVPIKKAGLGNLEDQRMEISKEMPEFFSAVSTLKNVDIDRTKVILPKPKPVVRKKVISAPLPIIYKRDSLGRRVCNKGSKDHPGKSNQNKGKHMDMECCLDPDEYPNPNCYYSESKYGKYL